MTTSILLDTNVVLDYTMERGEFFAPAKRIMDEIIAKRLKGYVTASQVTDIYYFLEKEFDHEKAVEVIADLIASVEVIGVRLHPYPTKRKISDKQMEQPNIEWSNILKKRNYTIKPRKK